MWYSEEEIEIDSEEYVCGIEMVKHYDTIDWVIGSIFIPISLGLLGLSFTEPIMELGEPSLLVSLLILGIGSCALYVFWLMVDRRFHFYMNIVFERLHELEKKYRMKTHREIRDRDKALPFREARRITALLWIFLGVLVTLWASRIILVYL